MAAPQRDYLPALRFRALTPLFDRVVRATTREREFKRSLLDGAGLRPGHRVLDLGCGTGTLAIAAKQDQPECELIGLDADPEVIERARQKAAAAEADVRFDVGFSSELPYEDRSFDRVLSTLFFHHLTSADKRATIEEIGRVLVPGGELHVGDYGRPEGLLMRTLSWQVRLLDGLDRTRENFSGALPRLFAEAGLDVSEGARFGTVFGTLVLYRARRPG